MAPKNVHTPSNQKLNQIFSTTLDDTTSSYRKKSMAEAGKVLLSSALLCPCAVAATAATTTAATTAAATNAAATTAALLLSDVSD